VTGKLTPAMMDKISKQEEQKLMATKATKKKKGGKYSSIPGAGKFSKEKLDKVYKRGLGAYYSSGSRPKTSAQAMGNGKS
jgi:hypothetical protein